MPRTLFKAEMLNEDGVGRLNMQEMWLCQLFCHLGFLGFFGFGPFYLPKSNLNAHNFSYVYILYTDI